LELLDFLLDQQKERELSDLVLALSKALQERDATIRALTEKVRENREALQALANSQAVLNQNQHDLAARQVSSTVFPVYRSSTDDDTWN